jgi:hypothetical protein
MDEYDQDQFQEVSTVSWFRRIGNAFWGMIFGLLCVIGGFWLIAWNEANGLHTAQSFAETAKAVIAVPISPVDQKNNQRVIYLFGVATTDETLSDPLLMVSGQALLLNRKVENYQWLEAQKDSHITEKHREGSETKSVIYYYTKGWKEGLVDSHSFKHPAGHENPTNALFTSQLSTAKKITLGDFTLPAQLYKDITASITVDLSQVDLSNIQKATQQPLFRSASEIYIGADPKNSNLGDARITLTEVMPQEVSVIGQQVGDTLQPYLAPAGKSVLILVSNHQPPQAMLRSAEIESNEMTWVFRSISLFLLALGVFLLLLPLNVIADIVPIVGSIVGAVTLMSALLMGVFLWCVATAIAWMLVRPELAAGLFGVALVFFIIWFKLKKPKMVVTAPAATEFTPEPTFPIEDDEKYHAPPE